MGKRKPESKIKREFSAGGVVFKKESGQVFWLITKSTPSKLYPKAVLRLPKGWIDDKEGGLFPGQIASGEKRATEEELKRAALKEVEEEAGVKAKIIGKVGTEKIFITTPRGKVLKFITFYLMQWLKDLKEGFGKETSGVQLLSFNEARKALSYSGEKKNLDKAKEFLDQKNLI